MNRHGDPVAERLRDRMEQTKALYDGATALLNRAMELHEDLGPNHPDGRLSRAIRIERFAARSYRQARLDFNKFILDGKLPEGWEELPPDTRIS